jgi:hypothetical protein
MTLVVLITLGLVASVILWNAFSPGRKAFKAGLNNEPDEITLSKWLGFYSVTYQGHTDFYWPWQRVPDALLAKMREAAAYRGRKNSAWSVVSYKWVEDERSRIQNHSAGE